VHGSIRRPGRTLPAVAVPVGLVLSAALTWQSTYAAFSATTGNAGNSWRSGTVTIADGDGGAALFSTAADGALRPGSTRSTCIQVDYTGDLTADVRMYVGTPPAGATALDAYLVMSVERGADVAALDTVAADCSTGFTAAAPQQFAYNTHQADPTADAARTMADLKGLHGNYGTGLAVAPATAPGAHLAFKITYFVADDNRAQNAQSNATFTWEARNT